MFPARFSPDGKHIAYAANEDGHLLVVLDGKEISTYELVVSSRDGVSEPTVIPYAFDKNDSLCFIGSRNGTLYWVECKQ
jgi:hypothetical protein